MLPPTDHVPGAYFRPVAEVAWITQFITFPAPFPVPARANRGPISPKTEILVMLEPRKSGDPGTARPGRSGEVTNSNKHNFKKKLGPARARAPGRSRAGTGADARAGHVHAGNPPPARNPPPRGRGPGPGRGCRFREVTNSNKHNFKNS